MVPMPDEFELASYYAAYTDEGSISLAAGAGSRHPGLRRLFHTFTGDVDPRDFVTVPAGGTVLDYGSGQGTYLRDFHERGIDIWGAEVTDTLVSASSAAGLQIRKVEDFSSIPFESGAFDVVYLMQVFEHLRDPQRFMAELARIIKPGGQLYLAVPNFASAWRKVFGQNWVSGWFAPFHLAHYNAVALGRLAATHGFVVRRHWSRTPDSWFRLNLRAWLQPDNNALDRGRSTLDVLPLRLALTLLMRVCELFVRERDCLVMHLERR
jgi:2-polyprenyl-3-methyl-5-hydroxy-6-metoxy-1,4-benzoquinol methylase